MNAVIYHSNTGNCKKIAQYAAKLLGYAPVDMLTLEHFAFENMVIVFPVHCQNLPTAIVPVLEKLRAKRVAVLAAYGRMSYGNVLWESQKRYRWNLAAAAYIPTAHCYIENDRPFSRWEELDFLAEAFQRDGSVTVPRSFKNPLADLFPAARSRLGVRLLRGPGCTSCGLCQSNCRPCVRCLKCVQACPEKALTIRLHPFLALYLKKQPKDALVIYC